MNSAHLTYENLFALLASLGFREERPLQKHGKRPHVFIHDETDTVLAFRHDARKAIRPVDLLSADVHLFAKGLVEEPLETLLSRSAAKA